MTSTVPVNTTSSDPTSSGSAPEPGPSAAAEAHARFAAPRGTIHPDRDLGWIRRLWPVVAGHRGIFAIALGASVISLALRRCRAPHHDGLANALSIEEFASLLAYLEGMKGK